MDPILRLLSLGVLLAAASAVGGQEVVELGRSVEWREVVARVFGEPTPGVADTALVIASIHGSEPAGTPLVERLEGWLVAHPGEWRGTRVVIVPVANPDGYARRERFNRSGVDLNRNFPADNRTEKRTHGPTPLSEPESVALMRCVQRFDPARVVSLHQPIACVDYDGPAERLAEAMSRAIDGRLPVRKLGARPGSFGAYVGETLGRPIVTLELPEGAESRSADDLWKDYGAALVAFVKGTPQESSPLEAPGAAGR